MLILLSLTRLVSWIHLLVRNLCEYPQGIEYVLASGVIVVKGGEPADALPGKVLKNQSRQAND